MRQLWQDRAPLPFVLRGRGRTIDVWGYSGLPAVSLVEHGEAFGDPSSLEAVHMGAIASKVVPCLASGRRVGFVLRACPVVRLASAVNGHRKGAEVDAFLAECFRAGTGTAVCREQVYRDWLACRLGHEAGTGAVVERIRIAGMSRERFFRRCQGTHRTGAGIERPDVRFDGDLIVRDGRGFVEFLARGVGRHRSFGFGALMLVPPGTTWSS
jgi:CRISPR system Cascade subunit CasE